MTNSSRPIIIWDYQSRPGKQDELHAMTEIEFDDKTSAILYFNKTEGKVHISHNGNWGYIDYDTAD